MKYAALAMGFVCALGGAPAWAQQRAVASTEINLRAGPDPSYPVVMILPPGSHVVVQGCLGNYEWCDITYGRERGWAHAGGLHYPYQNRYVPLPSVATVIGIGVIGFALNDYWHDHYRSRSWYGDRHKWAGRQPAYRDRDRDGVPDRYDRNDGRRDNRRDARRDNDRDGRRDNARRDDDRRPRQEAAPIGRVQQSRPQQVRPVPSVRNDPNSGWDARNPNSGPADKP